MATQTGMRLGELLRLDWRDVDFSANHATLWTTKSRKVQTVPLNRIAREALLALRGDESAPSSLSRTCTQQPGEGIAGAARRAGIGKVTSTMFLHSHGTTPRSLHHWTGWHKIGFDARTMTSPTLIKTDFTSIEVLTEQGFSGFESVARLWADKSMIPRQMGVYLVISLEYKNPRFISPGVGGFFKERDPNVSIDELKRNFVYDTPVVYIGKAGSPTKNATLHTRLGQYLSFGRGKNVGHWGGRFIWQLENHADLLVCWKPTPNECPAPQFLSHV